MTILEQTCNLVLENPDTLLLEKLQFIFKHQLLAVLGFLIFVPLIVFGITSLIINPGKGKIKFSVVVWSYFISWLIGTVLSISGYLIFISF